jgi:hypothetical protein
MGSQHHTKQHIRKEAANIEKHYTSIDLAWQFIDRLLKTDFAQF